MVSRGVSPAGDNFVLGTGIGERWGSPQCEHFSPGSGRRSRPDLIRVHQWPQLAPSEPLNTESLKTAATGGSAAPPGSAQRIHATHPAEAIEVAIVVLTVAVSLPEGQKPRMSSL